MALNARQLRELRSAPVGESGNRVKLAQRLAEVTQEDIAAALGEHQPYVSDVARGRYQTITVAKARKFADYFGCSIEDLFPVAASEAQAS